MSRCPAHVEHNASKQPRNLAGRFCCTLTNDFSGHGTKNGYLLPGNSVLPAGNSLHGNTLIIAFPEKERRCSMAMLHDRCRRRIGRHWNRLVDGYVTGCFDNLDQSQAYWPASRRPRPPRRESQLRYGSWLRMQSPGMDMGAWFTDRHHGYQPVEQLGICSLFKNDEMQGARISRNKAYLRYVALTRNEAQRRRSRFSTGCYRGRHGRCRPDSGRGGPTL